MTAVGLHLVTTTDAAEEVSAVVQVVAAFAESKPWQSRSNCLGVDPDLFFPNRGASTAPAREVCKGCQVRLECLDFALVNSEKFGIWGGLSERERRRLRRDRLRAARNGDIMSLPQLGASVLAAYDADPLDDDTDGGDL